MDPSKNITWVQSFSFIRRCFLPQNLPGIFFGYDIHSMQLRFSGLLIVLFFHVESYADPLFRFGIALVGTHSKEVFRSRICTNYAGLSITMNQLDNTGMRCFGARLL